MQKILSIACCILWLAAAIATQLPEDSKPDPEKIIQKLQAEANEKDAKLENLTNERDAKSKAIKTLPPTVLGSVNRALSQTKVCMSEDKVDGECVTGSTDSVTDSTDFGTDQLGEQKFDGPEQNNSFMTVAGPNTSRIDGPPATTNCYPMMVVPGATGLGSCDKCPYLNTLSWVPGYGDRNDAYHKYYVTGHPVDTTTGCGACPHGSHAYDFMDVDAYYSNSAKHIPKVAGKHVKYVVTCRRDKRPLPKKGAWNYRRQVERKGSDHVMRCLPSKSSQIIANAAPMTCIKQAEVRIESLYNDGGKYPDGSGPGIIEDSFGDAETKDVDGDAACAKAKTGIDKLCAAQPAACAEAKTDFEKLCAAPPAAGKKADKGAKKENEKEENNMDSRRRNGPSRWDVYCKVWKIVTCKDGTCHSAKRVTFDRSVHTNGKRDTWEDTALFKYKYGICSGAAASA